MKLLVYILSDQSAVGIKDIALSTLSLFDVDYEIKVFDMINSIKRLSDILTSLKGENNSIFYHSFTDSKMSAYIQNHCLSNDCFCVGLMDFSINSVAGFLKKKPKRNINLIDKTHDLHLRRIDALDFALKFDDGQDFRGLAYCDIAIIGVSRSSKTPLSMYLASLGYKVSNIPLLVDSQIPKEIFEIDPRKIFGLTIEKDVLKRIRDERLRQLNLSTDSLYSSPERISSEINYALELMNDLGCTIIDVTYKSIEETSEIIIGKLNKIKEREKQ